MLAIVLVAALISANAYSQENVPQTLSEARELFLTGKYSEAAEFARRHAEKDPVAAAILWARSDEAVGKRADAVKHLVEVAGKHGKSAVLPAELARLAFERGEHEAAKMHVEAALALDKDQPLARWVQAELYRTSGRLKEAEAAYQWFVDFYNERDEIKDADTLRLIGLAAGQYARWNRLSDQYRFLVNELYPEILKHEKNFWPAHYEAGLLFLEKFNQAEAAAEFNKALAINPNAAEVHAAQGALALVNFELPQAKRSIARALEINPELVWAKQLQADVQLANLDAAAAIEALEEAVKLNPRDEGTLGRMAAAYVARDGINQQSVGRSLQTLVDEVNGRNAHAGEFYNAVGDGLDKLRRYPAAGQFYERAIERMPQLVAPYGQLGLIQMRLGDEAAAAKTLAKAFEVDPFNVRVSNSIKVLEVLAGYATIDTEHFVIKFDRGQDEVLARCAARYLEDDVYPALCKRLGYEPRGKSLFEFFSRAKNTDGHGWFSARMVGLPYVGTVGACAGGVVAMQSPNDAKQPFNWARVLRHEFVHVVNLQQTNYNIPHWFTEALAVQNEDLPRPEVWNDLLAAAIKNDKLFDLETINGGFTRPKSGAEWNLAYCQAELYAEYMLARFGDDALARLLAAYADNLPTRKAIERSFMVEPAEFDRGYWEYLRKVAATVVVADGEDESLDTLRAAHTEKPEDNDAAARLAAALLRADKPQDARKLVDQVLKREPKHQLATYVLVRLRMRAGESDTIVPVLENALDRDKPQTNLLALLAGLKLKAEAFDDAAALYELGRQKYPGDKQWTQALARVYLVSGQNGKLASVLSELAEADAESATVRKKLAQLAFAAKDWAQAERWAREAIYIDVKDAEMHRIQGEALAAQGKNSTAIESFQVALRLDERNVPARVGLVRAYAGTEQREKARVELEALERIAPEDESVEELKQMLKN
jgi:tetratricopeptide (TPR) repeat protein